MHPRLKAFLSFVTFLVVVQLVGGGLEWILVRKLQYVVPTGRPWQPSFFVLWEGAGIVGALAATWVVARLNRRAFAELGFRTGDQWRQLLAGGALGFVTVTVLVLFAAAFGTYTVGQLMMPPVSAMGYAAAWLLAMAGTAFAGEMTLHGAGLFTLAEVTGFWPAAVTVSLLASVLSVGSRASPNYAGAVNTLGVGLLSCYAIQRTGAIWFAAGLHALLDFTTLFVYGSPSRGNQGGRPILTRLFTGGFHGPVWLTGGFTGIESSWLLLPIVGAVLGGYWLAVHGTARGLAEKLIERSTA